MDEKGKKRKGGAEKLRDKKKKALEVDAVKCFKLTDYAFGAKASCSSAGSDGSSITVKDSEAGSSSRASDDEWAPADDDQHLSPSLTLPEPSEKDGNQTEPVSWNKISSSISSR